MPPQAGSSLCPHIAHPAVSAAPPLTRWIQGPAPPLAAGLSQRTRMCGLSVLLLRGPGRWAPGPEVEPSLVSSQLRVLWFGPSARGGSWGRPWGSSAVLQSAGKVAAPSPEDGASGGSASPSHLQKRPLLPVSSPEGPSNGEGGPRGRWLPAPSLPKVPLIVVTPAQR